MPNRKKQTIQEFFKKPVQWLFCVAVCLFLIPSFTYAQNATEPITLRVGVYNNSPKIYIEEGVAKGFWADLTDYIAEQEGWDIEYVQGNWTEGLRRLETGEIDMMADVAVTDSRKEKYDFTTETVLPSWSEIYVLPTSGISDFIDLEDKIIGVLKDSSNYLGEGGIKESLDVLGIDAHYVEFDSYDDVFEAVENGGVDAGVTNMIFGHANSEKYGLRHTSIIIRPSRINFAFSKKGAINDQLIERIDYHISQLKADPDSIYYQSINDFYGSIKETFETFSDFTDAEKAWLAAHREIRIGADSGWPPFDFFDDLGEYRGMCHDYGQKIESILAVHFIHPPKMSWDDMMQKVKKKEIDIIPCIAKTEERSEYLLFTKPYLELPVVLVTKADMPLISDFGDMSGKKLSVVKGYGASELLEKDFPDIIQIPVENIEEALKTVSDGKADGAIETFAVIKYVTQRLGIKNLKISATLPYTIDVSFGVRKDWPEMVGILNKALLTLSDEDKKNIQDKWTTALVETTVDWGYIWKVILSIGAGAIFIIGIFLAWNRRLAKQVFMRRRAESSLKKAKAEAERRAQKLEKMRFATLNILEDSEDARKELAKTNEALQNEIAERERIAEDMRLYMEGFESSPDAMILVDYKNQKPKITHVNKSFVNFYGYTAQDAIGKNPHILSSDEIDKESYRHMWKAILDNKVGYWQMEIKNKKKDGTLVDVLFTTSTIFDKDGKPAYFMAHYTDITERKAIDRAKNEFVSLASHQLRTPLTGIKWLVQAVLKRGGLNEWQVEFLEDAIKSNDRMIGLVNDLLNISRLEAGAVAVEPKKTDLSAFLKELVREAEIDSSKKAQKIQFKKPRQKIIIPLDQQLIGQVITNLLSNAIKYSDANKNITVTLKGREKEVDISVADQGIGLTKNDQSKLFTKFFRSEKATKISTTGSGLGLYIVKKILDSSGGKIRYDSVPGRGTTFTITLPRKGMASRKGKKTLIGHKIS